MLSLDNILHEGSCIFDVVDSEILAFDEIIDDLFIDRPLSLDHTKEHDDEWNDEKEKAVEHWSQEKEVFVNEDRLLVVRYLHGHENKLLSQPDHSECVENVCREGSERPWHCNENSEEDDHWGMDRDLDGVTCILKLRRVDEYKYSSKHIEDDAVIDGSETTPEAWEGIVLFSRPKLIDSENVLDFLLLHMLLVEGTGNLVLLDDFQKH